MVLAVFIISDDWASNSAKTTDMWLNKDEWADLHEIAHGYQAGFNDIGMYTGEVSNNLFGVQYQYAKYDKIANQPGFKKQDYLLPDLMNKIYSVNSKQDFTPVLQRWGLDVDNTQASKNHILL